MCIKINYSFLCNINLGHLIANPIPFNNRYVIQQISWKRQINAFLVEKDCLIEDLLLFLVHFVTKLLVDAIVVENKVLNMSVRNVDLLDHRRIKYGRSNCTYACYAG